MAVCQGFVVWRGGKFCLGGGGGFFILVKGEGKGGRLGTGGDEDSGESAWRRRAGWVAAQPNALHALRGRRFFWLSSTKRTKSAAFQMSPRPAITGKEPDQNGTAPSNQK